MTWPMVALGELFDPIRNGKSIPNNKDAGGTPISRIETISSGTVDPLRVGYADVSAKGNEKWLLNEGDILFSHINSVEHIGKTALYTGNPTELIHGMNLLLLRPNNHQIDPAYAKRVLSTQHFKNSVERFVNRAVNQASISITNLKTIEIPLPPLAEQKRIAAILDKADALRRKRREALALLDTLTQSIFVEMFGDPVSNPKGWALGTIGDMLESANYGTSAKAGADGAYPILRMGNVTYSGSIKIDDLKFIDLAEKDVGKYTVRKGDVLFNRTNSADLVGKSAVFNQDKVFAFAGYLVRARVTGKHTPEYLSGYLNSIHGKAILRNMAKSIVGMANINAKEMQRIKILLPPKAEQERYSVVLSNIGDRRDILTTSLRVQESLFASLQFGAFSGAL